MCIRDSVQRVQNAQNLGDSVGNAIIELLVSLALAALAVVIVLGSGAEQLVLQLLVLLFAGFQFGFQ